MKARRYQLVLIVFAVLAIVAMVIALLTSGLSVGFFVVLLLLLAVAVLAYVYRKSRKNNEIVRCNGCGRTMIYSVFQKAGSCPRCHNGSYTRTGAWPKSM